MIEVKSKGYCVILNECKDVDGETMFYFQAYTLASASLDLQYTHYGNKNCLYEKCMTEHLVPVNFSFDLNGNIIEKAGSFTRLKPRKYAGYDDDFLRSFVVLASVHKGSKVGYMVLTSLCYRNGTYYGYTPFMLSPEAIASMYKNDMIEVQNAIFRNGKLYPFKQHPFLRINVLDDNSWVEA